MKFRLPRKPLELGQKPMSIKDRFKALKNLPRFFVMVWKTNPKIALLNLILRLLRSAIPISTLYIGKLIINALVHPRPTGNLTFIFTVVAIGFALAIISDLLNRATGLLDSMLGDLFANKSSIDLMEHAGTLDLDQFENADFYDKLEKARRQTLNRTILMSQIFSQIQDVITMAFLAGGLIVFNPWLILLLLFAVVPAFLG